MLDGNDDDYDDGGDDVGGKYAVTSILMYTCILSYKKLS